MGMELTRSDQGDIAIVAVSGNIGTEEAVEAESRLLEMVRGGATQLILELSGVEYMNSDGLGVLVKLMREIKDLSGGLRIANPGAFVQDVLETTKLTKVFHVHTTVDEAVAGMQQEFGS